MVYLRKKKGCALSRGSDRDRPGQAVCWLCRVLLAVRLSTCRGMASVPDSTPIALALPPPRGPNIAGVLLSMRAMEPGPSADWL